MKNKLLFVLLSAAAVVIGCAKEGEGAEENPANDGPKALVSFTIDAPGTAATKASSDFEAGGDIQGKIQVFIFNSNGTWDASQTFSKSDADASGKYSMECTAGTDKRIHVIANAPELSGITSEDKLLSSKLNLNAITPTSGIPMYGYVTSDISASADIPVQIKRMVAKVVVKKIVMGSGFKADGVLALNDMYMLNVPGEVNYVKRTDTEDLTDWNSIRWYNKMKYEDGTFDALRTALSGISNLKTNPYNGTSWFYVLPNKYTNDETRAGSAWSPRPTRLSIKGTFTPSGKSPITYYYPITINPKDASGNISAPIEANKVYTFETITINHLGSTTDDNPVTAANVSFSISVADWDELPATNPTL